MIIDTSALVAIVFREPEAEYFTDIILRSNSRLMSVGNFVEVSMVLARQTSGDAVRKSELFIADADILLQPVSVEHGLLARQAFLRFGKGRHPAGLNFGDCFAYALAKQTGEPLLFKGNDFSQTDLPSAS